MNGDAFRIDLRSAKLCIDLDCDTIFDATRHRDCPTCGSAEGYHLATWLNRSRAWPESTIDRREYARDERMRAGRPARRFSSMPEVVRREREAVARHVASG
jgi:hypothetical protein